MPDQLETQPVRLVQPDLKAARNQRLLMSDPRTSPRDTRSPARRDRDRVLYSAAWRRLGGVTQVITPFEDSALLHTRLTHSEKVAQVARSIAETLLSQLDKADVIAGLGGLDLHVVEAAALAHDLGHPPFAHIGEQTLDDVARTTLGLRDGFEGNAQTFRAVQLTETRHHAYDGLDLTCATLMAIAKYPWQRADRADNHAELVKVDTEYSRHWRKFSVYDSELEAFARARAFLDRIDYPDQTQSLEASIMDVADDITYAVHDLEDFHTAQILDIRRVLTELVRVEKGSLHCELRDQLKLDYPGFFDPDLFHGAVASIRRQLKKSFLPRFPGSRLLSIGKAGAAGSRLIGRYIEAVEVRNETFWKGGPFIGLRQPEWHEVQLLKKITREFVIKRPDMAALQRGQQRLLADLVVQLAEWAKDDFKRLPRYLREEIEITRDEYGDSRCWRTLKRTRGDRGFKARGAEGRCILDYICTLTDGQCYALHRKLSGAQPTAAMDFL